MTAEAITPVPGRRKAVRDGRPGRKLTFDYVSFMVVFLVIPVSVVLVFVVWPFIQAAYYSLTDWTGFKSTFNFIGFDNFRALWHDDIYRKAVRNNIIMAIVIPFVTIAIALTFASLITIGGSSRGQLKGIRNSTLYRVVSFFPYVVPAIAIGLIWSKMFDPSNGLLNGVLTKLGLSGFEDFAWLGELNTARACVMFVIIWGFVGFYMVLFVAAIKGVPAEVFEAARIDGAGRWTMTTRITIPLIRDAVQTAYIYLGIMALDAFVYTQALTPEGGPDYSTRVMTQELFSTAFIDGKAGRASAMGVVLAVITLLFAALVFTTNRIFGGKERIEMT